MKKLSGIITLFIFSFTFVSASVNLSGTVTDAISNEPLTAAHVVVENTFYSTATDKNGNFTFRRLSFDEGKKIVVIVSHIGYKTERFIIDTDKIKPQESLHFNLKLSRSAYITDEFIVYGTRTDRDAPATMTQIDKKELEKVNTGRDMPYLLEQTPSIVTTSDAGAGIGYTGLRLRGSDNTRINVMINNVPINDPESHGVWWVNMPDFASSVDNIQIQRGVGFSTHGAGSFGGSINIQTSQLIPEPYAHTGVTFGSFNTLRNNAGFGTGLINNKWVIDGRLSRIVSDGYIDRAASDMKSFYLSGGYYGTKDILRINVFSGRERTYQAWYGVPEDSLVTNRTYNSAGTYFDANGDLQYHDDEVDNYQQDHYQLHYSREIFTQTHLNTSFHYTKGRGYYEQYRMNQSFGSYGIEPLDTITDRTDLIRRRWLDNDFYGFIFSLNYNAPKNFNLTLGGAANHYIGDHFGEVIWARNAGKSQKGDRYYDNRGNKTDVNFYIKADYILTEKINLIADLQYRTVKYEFEGLRLTEDNEIISIDQDDQLHFFNPKAGISYSLNHQNRIHAFLGVGNKEPNRSDYTESTPESRPSHETLYNLELGYKRNLQKYSFALNSYYMHYINQLILTGEVNDVGNYTRQNVPESYRAGVELEFAWKPLEFLTLTTNATFSQNKIPEFTEYMTDWADPEFNQHANTYENTDIAFSPSVIAYGNIEVRAFKEFYITLVNNYVGKQYLDNTMSDDRQIEAYFVNDLRLDYQISGNFIRKIKLNFQLNNILNTEYVSNGYTYSVLFAGNRDVYNFYYPQSGRNFLAGIVMEF